jgi:hypothetical protein
MQWRNQSYDLLQDMSESNVSLFFKNDIDIISKFQQDWKCSNENVDSFISKGYLQENHQLQYTTTFPLWMNGFQLKLAFGKFQCFPHHILIFLIMYTASGINHFLYLGNWDKNPLSFNPFFNYFDFLSMKDEIWKNYIWKREVRETIDAQKVCENVLTLL